MQFRVKEVWVPVNLFAVQRARKGFARQRHNKLGLSIINQSVIINQNCGRAEESA